MVFVSLSGQRRDMGCAVSILLLNTICCSDDDDGEVFR